MSDDLIPQNLSDQLYRKLVGLHANARLIFVLDPTSRLALAREITAGGRTWPVYQYDGNDLGLRATLAPAGWTASRPGKRALTRATGDLEFMELCEFSFSSGAKL